MLKIYQKKGLPEKDEFVICRIKNLLIHSVFAELIEYQGTLEGMIPTSEIERRWVRNLKTYVKVGSIFVCKVIDVDPRTRHINLSLKRVGSSQKKAKMQEWSNEKKAYDLLLHLSKQLKQDIKKTFELIGRPLLEKHGLVYPILIELAKGEKQYLKDLSLDKKTESALMSFLEKRIKLPKIEINAKMSLETKDSDGINVIKNTLKKVSSDIEKIGAEATFIYLGAPKYKFKLVAEDYKTAEDALKHLADYLEKNIKAHQGNVEIERIK